MVAPGCYGRPRTRCCSIISSAHRISRARGGSTGWRGLAPGIMLTTLFYLPLVLWLVNAPYGPRYREGQPAPRRAVRGLGDIVQTMRDIKDYPVIVSMTLLAGAASFFVGNAYSFQMPGFAADLAHGD